MWYPVNGFIISVFFSFCYKKSDKRLIIHINNQITYMGPKIFLEFAYLYFIRRKPKYHKLWSRKSKKFQI